MSSRVHSIFAATLALAGLLADSAVGQERRLSQPRARAAAPATQRVIVMWRSVPAGAPQAASGTRKSTDRATRVAKLSVETGLRLRAAAQVSPMLDVVELDAPLAGAELSDALSRLRASAEVEFAEPDERRYPHAVPNDPLFTNQWYLQGVQIAAVRAGLAWDTTVGSTLQVVAVLDTGVRYDHPDLGAKLLPGFDFVSPDAGGGFAAANDGDGRDSDATDPGDWISAADVQNPPFNSGNCSVADSSWHGTRVSGIIGALTDNATGVAGISWNSPALPVRVLGRCGGNDSDILAAMRWAAGLAVGGVPVNSNPARVINLSLGSEGPCRQTYVTVLNELSAAGVVVVASAGNDGGPVDAPGNCPGVIAVGAVRHIGTKVGFSNVGTDVTISAPGGNCVNVGAGQPCLFSIDTTTNTGITVPASASYTDQFNFNVGTSFSAPIVSGALALMRAVNPGLAPAQLTRRLRESARPFPTTSSTVPAPPVCHVPTSDTDLQIAECICTTQTCGAGTLDASGAVVAAFRPLVAIQAPASSMPGQSVALDASTSTTAPNRTIVSYEWTVLFSSGPPPTINGAAQSGASVLAPASGELALRLRITDSSGAQDTAYVAMRTGASTTTSAITVSQDQPSQTPAPPPPGGGGSGGGGATGLGMLALLAGILAVARQAS